MLVVMGLLLVGLGFLLGHGGRAGRLLPGDIVVSRPGFTFVFPIVSSIVLSMLLTLVLWIIACHGGLRR